jgi:hypothetical protein
MLNTLAFVLAGSQELPGEDVDWQQLVGAQQRGPGLGRSLRIFRLPDGWSGSLDQLVGSGSATIAGEDPLPEPLPGSAPRRALVCDALVPHLEVPSLWIGVYALSGQAWPLRA